jgi:hypothetical protein
MQHTGIFVTPEELDDVKVEQSCSGMYLSGGRPMGDPGARVAQLSQKYNAPTGSGLNIQTGEFMLP